MCLFWGKFEKRRCLVCVCVCVFTKCRLPARQYESSLPNFCQVKHLEGCEMKTKLRIEQSYTHWGERERETKRLNAIDVRACVCHQHCDDHILRRQHYHHPHSENTHFDGEPLITCDILAYSKHHKHNVKGQNIERVLQLFGALRRDTQVYRQKDLARVYGFGREKQRVHCQW